MAYTSKGIIQRYLTTDIHSSFDSQISDWITAVTNWINNYTGKTFETASADKYYDGNGLKFLPVDTFVGSPTVTILNIDGTTDVVLTEGHANDYVTYPLNETAKDEIHLTANARYTTFPKGIRRIKITADFGYASSVPKDIELVATKLVAEIIREGLKGGKLDRVQLGDYEAQFKDIDEKADALGIYNILDMYRDIII